jgi:hypothetical protein
MNEPQLFEIIELLVDWPNYHLTAVRQGALIECFAEGEYDTKSG